VTTWFPLPFGGYSAEALDVAVDGAGRIVVVGYASESWDSHPDGHLAVLRYLPNGELDPAFGGDGVVTTPIGPGTNGRASAVAIQADGRIVVAGMGVHPSSQPPFYFDPAVVRYLADGSLDPAFGAGGIVVTPFVDPVEIVGMALQPDGRIVLAGTAHWGPTDQDPLVLRYHPSGFPDETFGAAGVVRLTLNGYQRVTDVALTSTGRILLTASATGGALLVRLRSSGELDDTFNGSGLAFTPNGPSAAIVLQPDRKIVVPGARGCCMAVARHHSIGPLDAAFGDNGVVWSSINGRGYDAVVQVNGRIVVAGAYGADAEPLLWRVEADGTPDASFHLDLPTSYPPSGSRFNALALQPDGKLVAAGRAGEPPGGILVARFHGDPTDLIFEDGFESGGTTAWSSTASDGGDLIVTAGGVGGAFGLHGTIDDTAPLYVQDDTPEDEHRYRARFALDSRDFDPGEAQDHRRTRTFIVFSENPTRRLAAIVLRRVDGAYAVMGRARVDDNAQANTPWVPLAAGPHWIELDLRSATGPDTLDGWFHLWVDGAPVAELTALDNSLSAVDFVRLGALSVKSGASGTLSWDEFESRRESSIGP
jgi:uncharacterized delta-60 repeat protein